MLFCCDEMVLSQLPATEFLFFFEFMGERPKGFVVLHEAGQYLGALWC